MALGHEPPPAQVHEFDSMWVRWFHLLYTKLNTQEPFVDATLLNNWMAYNTVNNTTGYMVDSLGIVHLRGVVKEGTISSSLPIFTLPLDYRPIKQEILATISNDVIGRIDVATNGDIYPVVGNNTYISLDGLTFKAVQ